MKKLLSVLTALIVVISSFGSVPPASANLVLSVVKPVPNPTFDTTPDITIISTKSGYLSYSGGCVGNKDTIDAGQNLIITYNQLNFGVYDNCKITINYKFINETLSVPTFEVKQFVILPINDDTPPVLTEEIKVPTPSFINTPQYTFRSSEAGVITYGNPSCMSSTKNAVEGLNTIQFNELVPGKYDKCLIAVTDTAGNMSLPLWITPFTVMELVPISIDTTAPSLKMTSPVATPTTDTTPNLTFWSSEAGTITYTGSCASDTVTAVAGNNTITLKQLALGTYNNCSLRVTDASGNVSDWRSIPSFTITSDPVNPPVILPTDHCAGFVDVSKTDSDCDAITYVKNIGAMTGNPNGTFEPSSNLQRDQVAKISLEAFNLFNAAKNYCKGNPFSDVTTNEWSYQYICRGVELGMITGYASGADAGYYRPARSVNRVEFLALTLRNLNETMPGVSSVSYKDVERGLWYSGFAKYSYDNSLFTGTNLYPDRFVTRREVARAIYQLHELNKI